MGTVTKTKGGIMLFFPIHSYIMRMYNSTCVEGPKLEQAESHCSCASGM